MKIIVDAKNPNDAFKFRFNKHIARKGGQTQFILMWDIAFITSEALGIPYEYEIGFTEFNIDEV